MRRDGGRRAHYRCRPNSVSSPSAAHTGSRSSLDGSAAPAGPAELRLGGSALINQDGTDGATITLATRVVASQPVDPFSDGPQNGYFVAVRVTVPTRSAA